MIRTALLLMLSVSARGKDQAQCALDGSAAAGNVITATVRMWAATSRCTKTSPRYDQYQCSWDILSTISSMSSVATTIAHAVDDCATLKTDECGLATADFLAATTALASTVDNAVGDCGAGGPTNLQTSALGNCVGDLAGSVHSLFASASSLNSIKEQCDADDNCAQNALGVLSALSSFGGGAAASYNDCDAAGHAGFDAFNANTAGGSAQAGCAADIMNSLSALSGAANSAIQMSKKCQPAAERLFAQSKLVTASRQQPSTMWMTMQTVGAFVILAVGFLGGMRWQQNRRAKTRDHLDVEEERASVVLME